MFNKHHSDRWDDKQAVRVINLQRDTLGLVFNHSREGGRRAGLRRRVRRLQRRSVIVVYETLGVTTLDFPTSGLLKKKTSFKYILRKE